MNYAIIGAGAVGEALARAFARKDIEVAMASRRGPEALAPVTKAIGPTIVPTSLEDALEAEIVILAVPFWSHRDVAKAAAHWRGKIIIDATNAYGVDPKELGVVSRSFAGARLVKAFNHLPARLLAEDPDVKGGRRVVFLSSDDEGAIAPVAALAERLGFAPVKLGGLEKGGLLVQARGSTWAPLIFQDLVSFR